VGGRGDEVGENAVAAFHDVSVAGREKSEKGGMGRCAGRPGRVTRADRPEGPSLVRDTKGTGGQPDLVRPPLRDGKKGLWSLDSRKRAKNV